MPQFGVTPGAPVEMDDPSTINTKEASMWLQLLEAADLNQKDVYNQQILGQLPSPVGGDLFKLAGAAGGATNAGMAPQRPAPQFAGLGAGYRSA